MPYQPKMCAQCGERPTGKGKSPRCAECRKTCATCRGPRESSRWQICAACRRADGTFARPRKHRICQKCEKPYSTTSGSYVCSSCKYRAAFHPCADCGTLVDPRAKVCMPCWGKRHAGENSPAWQGGRTRMKLHGYALMKCHGHPNADAQGYVREHVLVMSNVLGRPLLPGENVHHKNGVRDDNRPENLELWVKSQPSGQRVTDLLDWARTIVARYDPVEHLIREEEDVDVASPVLPLFGRTDR